MREHIPVYEPDLSGNELKYVTDCLESGWISSLGQYVTAFEEQFSRFCGVKYGVSVSNGTTALHLALATLGIGPGDEVIVPTFTFIATANAVTYTGARPVFVDSESATWNVAPAAIEAKITPRTRAIIVVHTYGHPADMDPILEIASKHSLHVIEDAAEAHGAEYKGRKAGSLGDMACFSFYGNKIITTGEGGMIVTDDPELAERARFLKDHAMSSTRYYWHSRVGYNYRLTNVQAAIGLAQLERAERRIEKKRQIAWAYNARLEKVKGLTLPPEADWAKSVYWMYSVLVEEDYGLDRDGLMARLKKASIDSRPFFYPMHTLPPYEGREERFPVAEELARKGINLPSASTLTEEDIERVCKVIEQKPGLKTPG
jgi:perosamine synthetase